MARMTGQGLGEPERTQHRAFGDIAAVWGVLERLNVVDAIDEACGPRRADAGASVGTYLALTTLNRIVAPCSKLAFAPWWASTVGPQLVKVPIKALDHRRFWDAMDALDDKALARAERTIAQTMVTEFGLDLSALALDMTNFATFIDSANEKAPIAQRGHAKQKRVDLRLVGLGLVVTRDGAVPVVSHAYPGNRPDVTQFPDVVDELVTRYRTLIDRAGANAPTVVFDAGQNSAANFTHLAEAGLHYVGSVPPSEHPALLARPADDLALVEAKKFPGLTAYDTRASVFGQDRRVVLTHSQTLHDAQARGFEQTLAKATRALTELAATLARGKTRRAPEAVQNAIDQMLRPRWVHRVITTTLTGQIPAELRLTWHLDETAHAAVATEIFGKRILVTDHDDWTVTDIVAGYRSQSTVESSFRQLKDPHVVGFSPMFHWTDQKIRVHVFYCVLALAVAHLMRRDADHAGLNLSVRELLDDLASIQETVLLYPGTEGRPRARRILTDMNPQQRKLYDLFNLDAHAPKRKRG